MRLAQFRECWGQDDVSTCTPTMLERLPLRQDDKRLLLEIGLPIRPERSLCLALRFETVIIQHDTAHPRRLMECDIERGMFFPKTDRWTNLWRLDLSDFVVIGEAPHTFERSSNFFFNRYICVDGRRGGVYWVSPKLREGRNVFSQLNSSLAGYLCSLLAYKDFREQWKQLVERIDRKVDRESYEKEAWKIHGDFLSQLKQADPRVFEKGFWKCHAMNETILMEIG